MTTASAMTPAKGNATLAEKQPPEVLDELLFSVDELPVSVFELLPVSELPVSELPVSELPEPELSEELSEPPGVGGGSCSSSTTTSKVSVYV